MEGFVGGQCAQESVRAAALDALRDDEPMLLRVLPDGEGSFPESPGARVVVNPCLSGGALEIFLQPATPPAQITVVRPTPTRRPSRAGDHSRRPSRRRDGRRLSRPDRASSCPLTATMSTSRSEPRWTRGRLHRAGGEQAPRVSRSWRRWSSPPRSERVSALRSASTSVPARHWRSRLSIMAEVVRADPGRGTRTHRRKPTSSEPSRALDPICGMTVVVCPTPPLRVDGRTTGSAARAAANSFAAEVG